MPHYHIIFRACDAVFSLHSAPRPFGLDKHTLIKLSFLSLYDAVKDHPHTIDVVGDKLSEQMQHFFRQFPVTLTLGSYGNDESIRQTFRIAASLDETASGAERWVYFCEDDYLHRPEMFVWLTDLIERREEILSFKPRPLWVGLLVSKVASRPLVIHPPDYPDRYLAKWRRFSMLFLGAYCHWRQVDSTTFTFLTHVSTVKRYKRLLMRSATGANDRLLSRRWYAQHVWGRGWFGNERVLCLSPVPGLNTHLHSDVMTPLVEWEEVKNDVMKRYAEHFG
jgi:hypothetical protein